MRRHLLFASAVLLVCFAVNAKADCAPPAPAKDERKKLDTEGAIAKLWKRFDRLKGGVNVEIEKKEIFSAYPNADQVVVLLTVLYNACASNFSDEEKLEIQIDIAKLFTARVSGPQPIFSIAPSQRNIGPSVKRGGDDRDKKPPPPYVVST